MVSPKTCVLVAGVLLVSACVSTSNDGRPVRRAPGGRPNILIIITDDQRAGIERMPSTTRLFARGGTSFENAFVTTPLCCPSRASIFTGRYAHNHGVHNNYQSERLDQQTTLQWLLRESGYRTAIFGKYFNHWDVARPPPHFDSWATYPPPDDSGYYYNGRWNVNGVVTTVRPYATKFITEQATSFLRRSESEDGQPWLLYLTPTAPHSPYTPEPKYQHIAVPEWKGNPAVLERNRTDKPPYVLTQELGLEYGDELRRKQLRALASVDDLVGRTFDTLAELEERYNTLAFFVSDNGSMWGEHGLSNKRAPYTESIRVPLMMRWPRRLSPGVTDHRLAATIDIAPTALAASGTQSADPLDGASLLRRRAARSRLLLEYWRDQGSGHPGWASIRSRGYQYVEYYARSGGRVTFRELYRLHDDPWQLRNLLGDDSRANDPRTKALAAFHKRLARDRACSGDACP